MTTQRRKQEIGACLGALLAVTACAPQQQGTTAASSAAPVRASPLVTMDHQRRMQQCPALLQQVRQGIRLTPEQQGMVSGCQHMEHSMGSGLGRSTRP